jgi:hypothetical protein
MIQFVQDNNFLKPYMFQLHAEYNHRNDEYMAHRVLQAFDMSQFICMTSANADIVILGGDLNTEPGDLSYRIIRFNAQLQDSFHQAPQVCITSITETDTGHLKIYTFRTYCIVTLQLLEILKFLKERNLAEFFYIDS